MLVPPLQANLALPPLTHQTTPSNVSPPAMKPQRTTPLIEHQLGAPAVRPLPSHPTTLLLATDRTTLLHPVATASIQHQHQPRIPAHLPHLQTMLLHHDTKRLPLDRGMLLVMTVRPHRVLVARTQRPWDREKWGRMMYPRQLWTRLRRLRMVVHQLQLGMEGQGMRRIAMMSDLRVVLEHSSGIRL